LEDGEKGIIRVDTAARVRWIGAGNPAACAVAYSRYHEQASELLSGFNSAYTVYYPFVVIDSALREDQLIALSMP
jgi:hypothetical protein